MSIRPSYFLIEVSETAKQSTVESAPLKSYFVVHLMEILTNKINEIYNSSVSFRKDNRTILTGTVLAASTTRAYIEYKKQKLMQEQRKASIFNPHFYQYFLIKYGADDSTVMFSVVPQNLVRWVTDGLLMGPLHLPGNVYHASVLYAHDSEAYLLAELQKLKANCARISYAEAADELEDSWLLVQYSFRPSHVAYAIVNYGETVCRQENMHKDLLAYLPFGEDIVQAIIVRQSRDHAELQQELRNIEAYGSSVQFPLTDDTTATATAEAPATAVDNSNKVPILNGVAPNRCTVLIG